MPSLHTSPAQTAQHVLLVRPAAFGFNTETAPSNALQRAAAASAEAVQAAALAEFDDLVRALESEGVGVVVAADAAPPVRPDAIFPNNWVSFHDDGSVVLYPMLALNRRLERRREFVDLVVERTGFVVERWVDLTGAEAEGRVLEGTGSLVLDRVHRLAYACRSPRTDPGLVELWCAEFGYEPVIFEATDADGLPYYHTNVMLAIGSAFAVVAAEAVAAADRTRVLDMLAGSGRELIEIDRRAVASFAGNLLELASWDEALGDMRILAMSASARVALGEPAIRRLAACVDTVLAVPVPTIERVGGGSVRCMLAEIFLPLRPS
jgi:hypothetical protein